MVRGTGAEPRRKPDDNVSFELDVDYSSGRAPHVVRLHQEGQSDPVGVGLSEHRQPVSGDTEQETFDCAHSMVAAFQERAGHFACEKRESHLGRRGSNAYFRDGELQPDSGCPASPCWNIASGRTRRSDDRGSRLGW